MQTLIDLAVPAVIFVLLTAVGLDLTADDFARVRRQGIVVLTGLLAPLVVLPPIALGLIWLFRPAPEVSAGLLLVASCPIGGISNTYSYLARASTALSVTLTGLSCLLAGVTMPLMGKGLALALGRPLTLAAPLGNLAGQLLLMLGAPVALGMWARRRAPTFAVRSSAALRRAAFGGIGTIIALIILDEPVSFVRTLSTTIPLAAVFVMASMIAGWAAAAVVTTDSRDRFTLAAEFGTRNIGVAAAVAVTVLQQIEFARFAAIYFLTEMPLMLVAASLFRRRMFLPVRSEPA